MEDSDSSSEDSSEIERTFQERARARRLRRVLRRVEVEVELERRRRAAVEGGERDAVRLRVVQIEPRPASAFLGEREPRRARDDDVALPPERVRRAFQRVRVDVAGVGEQQKRRRAFSPGEGGGDDAVAGGEARDAGGRGSGDGQIEHRDVRLDDDRDARGLAGTHLTSRMAPRAPSRVHVSGPTRSRSTTSPSSFSTKTRASAKPATARYASLAGLKQTRATSKSTGLRDSGRTPTRVSPPGREDAGSFRADPPTAPGRRRRRWRPRRGRTPCPPPPPRAARRRASSSARTA